MATNLIVYAAPKETCENPQSHTEPKHCPDSPIAGTYNVASSGKFVVMTQQPVVNLQALSLHHQHPRQNLLNLLICGDAIKA